MINLSSFIQFIGALYLSIAIDSTLFKRFWNPDFFAMMSSNIKHYTDDKGVKISTELSNKLTGTAKDISNEIDTSSRMQGCMMLVYSVALLVAFGFKNNFVGNQINIASLSLFVFIVFGFISFFLSRIILKNWGCVFIYSALVLLLPFLVFIPKVALVLTVINIPVVGLKIILIVFLLLPIVWRIFYNWLYSSVYSKYNYSMIKNEFHTYVQTKQYLKNKQSEKLDDRYKSVLSDFYNNEGRQDTANRCAEIYVDLITKHCEEIPGIIELLKHRNDKIDLEDVNDLENEVVIKTTQSTTKNSVGSLENYYNEYENLNGTKKIVDFCKEKKIDCDEFKEYRKNRMKEKKK